MFTLFAIAIHQWPMSSRRYVPGRGRGATGFIGGVSRDEVGMRRLFEAGSGDIR